MADEVAQVIETEIQGIKFVFEGSLEIVKGTVKMLQAMIRAGERHHEKREEKNLNAAGEKTYSEMLKLSGNEIPAGFEVPADKIEEIKEKITAAGLHWAPCADPNPLDNTGYLWVAANEAPYVAQLIKPYLMANEQKELDSLAELRAQKAEVDEKLETATGEEKKELEILSQKLEGAITESKERLADAERINANGGNLSLTDYMDKIQGTELATDPEKALTELSEGIHPGQVIAANEALKSIELAKNIPGVTKEDIVQKMDAGEPIKTTYVLPDAGVTITREFYADKQKEVKLNTAGTISFTKAINIKSAKHETGTYAFYSVDKPMYVAEVVTTDDMVSVGIYDKSDTLIDTLELPRVQNSSTAGWESINETMQKYGFTDKNRVTDNKQMARDKIAAQELNGIVYSNFTLKDKDGKIYTFSDRDVAVNYFNTQIVPQICDKAGIALDTTCHVFADEASLKEWQQNHNNVPMQSEANMQGFSSAEVEAEAVHAVDQTLKGNASASMDDVSITTPKDAALLKDGKVEYTLENGSKVVFSAVKQGQVNADGSVTHTLGKEATVTITDGNQTKSMSAGEFKQMLSTINQSAQTKASTKGR